MDLDERPSGRDVLAALIPYALSQVAALFRAGDTATLAAIADAQPSASFRDAGERTRWRADFLAGEVDVWSSAGAWLFWRRASTGRGRAAGRAAAH